LIHCKELRIPSPIKGGSSLQKVAYFCAIRNFSSREVRGNFLAGRDIGEP
jgi:hypothetical protein